MEVEASVFREAAGWLIVRRSRALARSGGRAVEGAAGDCQNGIALATVVLKSTVVHSRDNALAYHFAPGYH